MGSIADFFFKFWLLGFSIQLINNDNLGLIQAVRQIIVGGWGNVDAGKVIQPSVAKELHTL